MLSQFGPSTWVALILGAVLAVLAFVPVAAGRYRRAGRLRLTDVLVLLMVAVYAVALWSYSLVPLPDRSDFRCVGRNLVPFEFIGDILADGHSPLHNRALLQVALNVVLFLPLGVFLRLIGRRGVVFATLTGLGVSALIEFTQLTGVWGIYHCAYRVFDVDDLIVNTTGALLGSLMAIPLQRLSRRRRPAPKAARVTLGRRLIGMLADLFVITAVGWALAIGWRVVAVYLLQWQADDLSGWVDLVLSTGVPLLLEGYWVLARGRTIGETMVGLEPVARPGTVLSSRLIKLATGVGGYLLLSAAPGAASLLAPAFALATLAFAIWTPEHRGLSHLLAGMELRIERDDPSPAR